MSVARIHNAAVLALAAALAAPVASRAQIVRVSGSSIAQFIQLKPLTVDTVPVEEAMGSGLIRRTADGHLVRCVQGAEICEFVRSADTESVVPVIQDITVSAWGFGQGLRVQAQLRSRAAISGPEELWPRADDAFDALVAFVELDRGEYRLRGGRQWKISGLGYYNFDGVSALYRGWPGFSIEGFAGWSLARGLNEPRTSESLSAIEAFAPDARALLLGAQVSYRPSIALNASLLYQREIRDDRLGLYTERVAADAVYRWDRGTVTGTLEADVASRELNDARLSGRYQLGLGLSASAFLRLYEPFFELWTIWGAFDPVGFSEVGAGLNWRSLGQPIELNLSASRRGYDDTNASTVFGTYRDTGWNLRASGSYRPHPSWLVQGDYGLEIGFGAARGSVGARVQHDLREATYVGASVQAFDRQFELRVAEGMVYGLGLDGRVRIGPRTNLSGSLGAYRHSAEDSPDVDWSQLRGVIRLDWVIGPEPGLSAINGGGG